MVLTADDRRDSPRVPTVLYVRPVEEDREFTRQMGDISLGGVGFEFPYPPSGKKFRVWFNLPGESAPRHACGELVYSRVRGDGDYRIHPYYLGLRFVEMDDQDEMALARMLDERVLAAPSDALVASAS